MKTHVDVGVLVITNATRLVRSIHAIGHCKEQATYDSALHQHDQVPKEIRPQHAPAHPFPRPGDLGRAKLSADPRRRTGIVVKDVLPPLRGVHLPPCRGHGAPVVDLVGLVDEAVVHHALWLDVGVGVGGRRWRVPSVAGKV